MFTVSTGIYTSIPPFATICMQYSQESSRHATQCKNMYPSDLKTIVRIRTRSHLFPAVAGVSKISVYDSYSCVIAVVCVHILIDAEKLNQSAKCLNRLGISGVLSMLRACRCSQRKSQNLAAAFLCFFCPSPLSFRQVDQHTIACCKLPINQCSYKFFLLMKRRTKTEREVLSPSAQPPSKRFQHSVLRANLDLSCLDPLTRLLRKYLTLTPFIANSLEVGRLSHVLLDQEASDPGPPRLLRRRNVADEQVACDGLFWS